MDLSRLFPKTPPPGPFRREAWRSPLRGLRLTAILGAVLLATMPLVILTGLLSYAAYNPGLGTNDVTPSSGVLGFYLFDWPTRPVWLYQLNQGVHVIGGLALVPIVLFKLWSVIPKLFSWPPVSTPAQAVERLSLLLLVGSLLFELVTGVLNIQYWYAFPFSFYTAHLYGGWVFIGAFVAHVVIKLPAMRRGLRTRAALRRHPLAAPNPAPETISRRGALALVGSSSLGIVALTAGQTLGGPFRDIALLAPRGRSYGSGPNDFQVNKPAASVGVTAAMAGPQWRLHLRGGEADRFLSRDDLLALEQHAYDLPIACVEGWSTVQRWSGVRLRDLAALAGVPGARELFAESLQGKGTFASTSFSRDQVDADKSLLALRVNGADLSLDHGYPARIIIPAAPGVHCTKWVNRMTFTPA